MPSPKTGHIQVLDRQKGVKVPSARVRRLCAQVLADQGREGWELSVVFVDDAAMRVYNRDFMGKDKPTNVLSLSQAETGDGEPIFDSRVLGDVIVSTQTCAANAARVGMEPLAEVVYCLVHGICHLLGHDHVGSDRARARRMKAAESDLFQRFGPIVLG